MQKKVTLAKKMQKNELLLGFKSGKFELRLYSKSSH